MYLRRYTILKKSNIISNQRENPKGSQSMGIYTLSTIWSKENERDVGSRNGCEKRIDQSW